MNTKLHSVSDSIGRPVRFFIAAGPVDDYTCTKALSGGLPKAGWPVGDRRYDADCFREDLIG